MTVQWTVSRARATWTGSEYIVTWWPSTTERRRAVFAPIATGTLVEISHIEYRYVDEEDNRRTKRDDRADLKDVPDELLTLMREDGVTPARGAEA